MNIRRAKIILAGLGLLLLSLVSLADSGHGQRLFALANVIPGGDKVGHFVLFGPLAFLVNLVWQAGTVRWFGLRWLKGSVAIMAVVTLEECSQVLFRSRTFDLLDLAADGLGIWLCGRLAIYYLNWRRLKTVAAQLPRG